MKKIYVSHSRGFDFQNELYTPLRESTLPVEFIFPHKDSDGSFNSKELFLNKKCDLVLAEASLPSTGQGIELGWADSYGIPIIACYMERNGVSKSLLEVVKDSFSYSDKMDLVNKLTEKLGENYA